MVGLTENGRALAKQIAQSSDYEVVARRAHVLKDSLNLTATGIMRFVYATFPEIASLKMNEQIET
jgi:hypothetical protein